MMRSISGERGVGKTLYLAEDVYRHSQNGYFCVTNFTHSHSNLDLSALSPSRFWDVVEQIISFKERGYEMFDLHPSFWHTGVYIAIDEGTLYISPDQQKRMQQENPEKYERLLSLLAQARKFDVYIDYVVQDLAKIGKDFRRYTEEYIYFKWFMKTRRIKHIKHPTKPIFRRETRSLIPLVWEEHHKLDPDHPALNYKRDPEGKWAEASTVVSRALKFSGFFKSHIYRMYNSYQPMAIDSTKTMSDFKDLKEFVIVPNSFKKDHFPTFKRLFGIIPSDKFLPTKYKPSEVILPALHKDKPITAEVQSQRVETLSVEQLQRSIAKAYARSGAAREPRKVAKG